MYDFAAAPIPAHEIIPLVGCATPCPRYPTPDFLSFTSIWDLKCPRAYARPQARHCHFVLQLVCLENRRQIVPELLVTQVTDPTASCAIICDYGTNPLITFAREYSHMYLPWHMSSTWWCTGAACMPGEQETHWDRASDSSPGPGQEVTDSTTS